jgi:nitrite reductase/ring-hydroxylating ferredoxin subunit
MSRPYPRLFRLVCDAAELILSPSVCVWLGLVDLAAPIVFLRRSTSINASNGVDHHKQATRSGTVRRGLHQMVVRPSTVVASAKE